MSGAIKTFGFGKRPSLRSGFCLHSENAPRCRRRPAAEMHAAAFELGSLLSGSVSRIRLLRSPVRLRNEPKQHDAKPAAEITDDSALYHRMSIVGVTRAARVFTLAVGAAVCGRLAAGRAWKPAERATSGLVIYDADPNHIWNRVHDVLHVRISRDGRRYGANDVDPLLWRSTKHLLTGKSHTDALAVLDEFLSSHAERLITDPVRRAVFQHDLWRVFDWADETSAEQTYAPAARELQVRLAKVMRRVALTRSEIDRLPDSSPLPEFFDGRGPLVCVFPRGGGPAASTHAAFFSESIFLVFIRLPGERQQTLAYLKQLSEYPDPLIVKQKMLDQNPDIPQFPPRTRSALVRQMMLIDTNGEIVPTHITESVQTRLYRTVPANVMDRGERDEAEFDLSREDLFAGRTGGLRQLEPNDKRFPVFMTHDEDPFEQPKRLAGRFGPIAVLGSCSACHEGSGIHSVCTYMCNARRPQIYFFLDDAVGLFEAKPDEMQQGYVAAKRSRHDFGLLEGLWGR